MDNVLTKISSLSALVSVFFINRLQKFNRSFILGKKIKVRRNSLTFSSVFAYNNKVRVYTSIHTLHFPQCTTDHEL